MQALNNLLSVPARLFAKSPFLSFRAFADDDQLHHVGSDVSGS